jgi:hypothetical protein
MTLFPGPLDYVIRTSDGRTVRVHMVVEEEIENGVLSLWDGDTAHLGSWPLVNVVSWKRTPR